MYIFLGEQHEHLEELPINGRNFRPFRELDDALCESFKREFDIFFCVARNQESHVLITVDSIGCAILLPRFVNQLAHSA